LFSPAQFFDLQRGHENFLLPSSGKQEDEDPGKTQCGRHIFLHNQVPVLDLWLIRFLGPSLRIPGAMRADFVEDVV
jgi:hypothetical protein